MILRGPEVPIWRSHCLSQDDLPAQSLWYVQPEWTPLEMWGWWDGLFFAIYPPIHLLFLPWWPSSMQSSPLSETPWVGNHRNQWQSYGYDVFSCFVCPSGIWKKFVTDSRRIPNKTRRFHSFVEDSEQFSVFSDLVQMFQPWQHACFDSWRSWREFMFVFSMTFSKRIMVVIRDPLHSLFSILYIRYAPRGCNDWPVGNIDVTRFAWIKFGDRPFLGYGRRKPVFWETFPGESARFFS